MSTCIAVHELCTEAGLEAEVAQQLESEEITVGILLRASLVERREILRSMGLRFGQIMSLNQALEHRKQGSAAEGGGAAEEAAAAAAAAAAAEEEEEEEEEEEDHVLAAEAYAAQLTSYEVLEWELAKLQGDTLDEAAEARRDGEWPPMHSAPAWPFALGRPPVGRCVASAKVPPCAAPTASARLGRTAIHSSTCIRMCTACSLHMHHMPAACAPQRSRRARFSSSSR